LYCAKRGIISNVLFSSADQGNMLCSTNCQCALLWYTHIQHIWKE